LGRQYDRPDRSTALEIAVGLSRVLERIVGSHIDIDFGSTRFGGFDCVHGHDSNLTLNSLSINEGQPPTLDVVAENIDGVKRAHESDVSARMMTTLITMLNHTKGMAGRWPIRKLSTR
jgi:hypothetical protein